MNFVARVNIIVWPYMEDSYEEERFHTIEAEDIKEAEEKINAHYESKSSDYSINYGVNGIDFFEPIS